MDTARLELQGELGTIPLPEFLKAVRSWLEALTDLDTALSRKARGSIEWVVTDLGVGSLRVAVAARSREEMNIGPRVALHLVEGMHRLESEGTTPPYMSERGLRGVSTMLKVIGSHGITGMKISSTTDSAELSAKASANVEQLLPTRYKSIGSVEGRLEEISVHRQHKFVVYHDRTHKAISCDFPADWLERVKDELGYRVNVAGVIHWNARGEQLRVDAQDIRRLRDDDELPSIRELAGSIPDMTGGLRSGEYLRSMQDG